MILILSNKWDLTVDFVVSELRTRGRDFLRINTEDLVLGQATACLPHFEISVSKHGRTHDLAHCVSVIWNRRPGKPFDDIPAENRPSLATQKYVNDQWYSWLEALQLIPGVTWINHPQKNDAMENKARQLLMASKVGFRIPETVITNDPMRARQFVKEHRNRAIAKALYSPLIEEPDRDYFVFTNEITLSDLEAEDEIRLSPSIFQQCLNPKTDYRVTVVGETVFSVRVERAKIEGSHIDWRTDKDDIRFAACDLPVEIENLCREYVQTSGLLFGALDLVRYKGGFFFLEINPNGEWGWLQRPNNIPIAQTLCDLMILHDGRGCA